MNRSKSVYLILKSGEDGLVRRRRLSEKVLLLI